MRARRWSSAPSWRPIESRSSQLRSTSGISSTPLDARGRCSDRIERGYFHRRLSHAVTAAPACASVLSPELAQLLRVPHLIAVHDGGAEILDVVEARTLRDRARLVRDDPELEPQGAGADGRRLLGVRGRQLGPAEDVDEVDRTVDLVERAHAGDAEDFVAAGR